MSKQDLQPKESFWRRLWQRPGKWWLFGIPAGGFLMFFGGIIFWGGFHTAVELSNTEAFCISCHEMREFIYPEYLESKHFKNPYGVRASCSDCHVPKPWQYKIPRKIAATNELWGKLRGVISTREKFEAHRAKMAESVWANMRASDSRECRNCHEMQHMDLDAQDRSAMKKHKRVLEGEMDKTCIDCHQGIAHKLPEGY